MVKSVVFAVSAVSCAFLSGCVTPGTQARYEDMTGKNRTINERQIDVAACMKDMADHRSASNLPTAVEYMTVCMQSKGWRIIGWTKPDGTNIATPYG